MPMMPMDRSCALIIVDLQKGLVALPFVDSFSEVLTRSVGLIEAFRAAGRPVVLVNTDGSAPGRIEAKSPAFAFPADWTELVPELNPQREDILITKRTWSAFPGTGLEKQLRSQGVTQVVLAGIATSMGVESTAREAHGLGFNVTVAIDAVTDLDAETQANSVSHIFPSLGETATSAWIAEALRSNQL